MNINHNESQCTFRPANRYIHHVKNSFEMGSPKSIHSFGICFYITRTQPDKNGHYAINCKISVNNNRVNFSTQQSIRPEDWYAQSAYVSGKTKDCLEEKSVLRDMETKITEHYRNLMRDGKPITPAGSKTSFSARTSTKKNRLPCLSFLKTTTAKWA